MCDNANSGAVVSEDELVQLAALFAKLEGAPNPLDRASKEAETQFNELVERIYFEKVEQAFPGLGFAHFKSLVRKKCRRKVNAEPKQYPCP